MKTSHVIAMLGKNSRLKYEVIDGNGSRHELSVGIHGYLYYKKWNKDGEFLDPNICAGGHFNGNIRMNYNWTLVREPVPVWEAIKALTEGKRIICEGRPGDGCKHCSFVQYDTTYISPLCLTKGKWYVEEPEA